MFLPPHYVTKLDHSRLSLLGSIRVGARDVIQCIGSSRQSRHQWCRNDSKWGKCISSASEVSLGLSQFPFLHAFRSVLRRASNRKVRNSTAFEYTQELGRNNYQFLNISRPDVREIIGNNGSIGEPLALSENIVNRLFLLWRSGTFALGCEQTLVYARVCVPESHRKSGWNRVRRRI